MYVSMSFLTGGLERVGIEIPAMVWYVKLLEINEKKATQFKNSRY